MTTLLIGEQLPRELQVNATALIEGKKYHWVSGDFFTYLAGTFVKWDLSESGYQYGGYFTDVYRYNDKGEVIEKMDNFFDNPDTFFAEEKQDAGDYTETMNF